MVLKKDLKANSTMELVSMAEILDVYLRAHLIGMSDSRVTLCSLACDFP